MTMTYTVKHCYSNPRNNRSVDCATRAEAFHEARQMTSGTNSGCSVVSRAGVVIASRCWNKSRLSHA